MLRILFSIMLVFLMACQEQSDDRLNLAREAIEVGDYNGAESLLVEEISRTSNNEDRNSEARRLLASVYVNRAGVSVVNLYDFLSTLRVKFFPEIQRISKRLNLRSLESFEEGYLIWKSLPKVAIGNLSSLQLAVQVLDVDDSQASALYRLLIRSIILKSHVSSCPNQTSNNAIRALDLIIGMATDYYVSFPDAMSEEQVILMHDVRGLRNSYGLRMLETSTKEYSCSF